MIIAPSINVLLLIVIGVKMNGILQEEAIAFQIGTFSLLLCENLHKVLSSTQTENIFNYFFLLSYNCLNV